MAWRQTAEFVSRFLTKGRLAIVEGKPRPAITPTGTATAATPRKWWPTTSTSATPAGTAKAQATVPPSPTGGYGAPADSALPLSPAAATRPPLWWISSLTSPTTTASCPSEPLSSRGPSDHFDSYSI